MNDEVLTNAKVVPLFTLQKEVSIIKSHKKEDYIKYLYANNKKKLEYFISYYSQLKKRNVFFLYSKKKLDFDAIRGRKIKDASNDLIFEFKSVNCNENKAIVNVKAHSLYEYNNVEEPEKLTPMDVRFRRGFDISFIYHTKDSIIECRTRSKPKFLMLKQAIELIFKSPTTPLIITEQEYGKIDKITRYRSLTASGLNLAGANKLSIEGDDVEQTLKYFKSKKIDLKGCCENLAFDKAVTNEKSIMFYDNGKVTYRPIVEDIYGELRGVLLNHVSRLNEE